MALQASAGFYRRVSMDGAKLYRKGDTMRNAIKACLLVLTIVTSYAFAGQDSPDLSVPAQVIQVYVILQAPGEPIDGSSSTVDVVSRDKFIADFERYRNIAREKQVKLIVTAVTEDEKWIQNQIKYRGKNLRRASYRDPHASITYSGAEVPLD